MKLAAFFYGVTGMNRELTPAEVAKLDQLEATIRDNLPSLEKSLADMRHAIAELESLAAGNPEEWEEFCRNSPLKSTEAYSHRLAMLKQYVQIMEASDE